MFFDTTIDISFFSCNVNSYIEKQGDFIYYGNPVRRMGGFFAWSESKISDLDLFIIQILISHMYR